MGSGGVYGQEEEESGFTYDRHTPSSPPTLLFPPHTPLSLSLFFLCCFLFFFCSELFKTLCVLSSIFVVMILVCSEERYLLLLQLRGGAVDSDLAFVT